MTEFAPAVTGFGVSLGENRISNQLYGEMTGVDPAWIGDRTGIGTRYWADPQTHTVEMAILASRDALLMAGLTAEDLNLIELATSTPKWPGASTVADIHAGLGASARCRVMQFPAACAGGGMSLEEVSDKITLHGGVALAIGAERLSSVINLADRTTGPLFSDAAGAAVVELVEGATPPIFTGETHPAREILGIHSGGTFRATEGEDDPLGKIAMEGGPVFRYAVDIMPRLAREVAEADGAYNLHTGIDWDRYTAFVPHPGSGRIARQVCDLLKVPEKKRFTTINEHGNASAASLFLGLQKAHEAGAFDDDENTRVLSSYMGAGILAGAGAYNVRPRRGPRVQKVLGIASLSLL